MEPERVAGMSQGPRVMTAARGRAWAWQAGLAMALLAALVLWAMPEDAGRTLVQVLAGVEPLTLAVALALYPLITVARAIRLLVALGLPLAGYTLWALMRTAAVHSVLASFVPMRLGEISLVWLLNRAVGTPVANGSALLLVLRLLDLAVVLGAGILALAWLPAARAALPQAGPLAGAVLVALLVGLAVAPVLARRLLALTPVLPGRVGRFLTGVLTVVGAMTAWRLSWLLAWSLPVWAPIFVIAWLCANALEPSVGLAGGVAGGSATALASVLPVNTVANVGTFEAAWMLALVPAGLDRATALATGILFHLVVLSGSAILGLLALPGRWRRAPDEGQDRPEAGTFPGHDHDAMRAGASTGATTERG